jgi:hypothetical protein
MPEFSVASDNVTSALHALQPKVQGFSISLAAASSSAVRGSASGH